MTGTTWSRWGRESGPTLVVDDDEGFRSFAATILSSAGFAVREAATRDAALAAARTDPPVLVLLDVCLPEISGFELFLELRDQFGDSFPIIFVSGTRCDALDRSAGLLIGADDYLVKPVDPTELLARVRTVLTRSRRRDRLAVAAEWDLTEREIAVLQQLALGLTQREIAVELSISPRTVGNHIQHILAKLGVHSRLEAAAVAYEVGLVDYPSRNRERARSEVSKPKLAR